MRSDFPISAIGGIPLAIIILSTILGCSASKESDPSSEAYMRDARNLSPSGVIVVSPTEIGSVDSDACPADISISSAPLIEVRRSLPGRLNSTQTAVIKPIRTDCIKNAYGMKAINNWAKRGDPAARFVSFKDKYKNIVSICANMNEIHVELLSIYSTSKLNGEKSGLRSLMPEAYYLDQKLLNACGRGSDYFSYDAILQSGFDPARVRPYLRPSK